MQKEPGFTLVEVIVSLMIILVVAAGILSSFVVSAGYVRNSKDRITSVDINRLGFENLRQNISQDQWQNNTGNLSTGTHNITGLNISNVLYNITYNVTNVTGSTYRNVTMKINYTAPD